MPRSQKPEEVDFITASTLCFVVDGDSMSTWLTSTNSPADAEINS